MADYFCQLRISPGSQQKQNRDLSAVESKPRLYQAKGSASMSHAQRRGSRLVGAAVDVVAAVNRTGGFIFGGPF
jgi:hypothetical protein